MTEYTPTTEEVAVCWTWFRIGDVEGSEAINEFDRWLDEHDGKTVAELVEMLKKSPAVTLTGQGGAFELIEKWMEKR